MKKVIIFISLIFIFFIGIAQSQQTHPPLTQGQPRELNPKSSTSSNIESKNNNDISTNPVTPINKIDTHGSDAKAQNGYKPNNDGQFGAVKNDPITRYTFWLMIFTAGLVICNILLWLYTKKAADAAKKAADALPAIERAYIFVNLSGEVKPSLGVKDPLCRAFSIPVNLSNDGKTPAVLIKVDAGIIITRDKPTRASTEHIMIERPFNDMMGDDTDKREIGSGGTWKARIIITTRDSAFTEFLETNLVNSPSYPFQLFCCGKVIYKDMLKERHTTWFCWEYSRSGFFKRADNDELNDYT